MSEKKDAFELNDEELEKVTGGGNGHAENGIYGETYTSIETGRYYCGDQYPGNATMVLYVTGLLTGRFCCAVRREKLYFDADNNWHTEFVLNDHYTSEEMSSYYNYVLNIRP